MFRSDSEHIGVDWQFPTAVFCLLSWGEHGCVRASQSRVGRELPPPASCVRHPATQQLQHLQPSEATRERRRRRTTEKIQWDAARCPQASADVKCSLQRASVGGYWRLDDEGNSTSSCHAQSSDTASIANNLKLLPYDAAAGRATASEVSAPVEPAADCHAMRPCEMPSQVQGHLSAGSGSSTGASSRVCGAVAWA